MAPSERRISHVVALGGQGSILQMEKMRAELFRNLPEATLEPHHFSFFIVMLFNTEVEG